MNYVKKLLKKYNDIPIVAKATIWFVFCSTLQKCMSLITTPIFTRLMSTEQYGQFTVYNSWVQILTIITTFRLNYSVFNKGMSKYKEDRDSYASTMQIVTFAITAVLFLIYLIFQNFFNNLFELPGFIIMAMFCEMLVFPAVDFWTVRKRYEYIYRPVVARTILMVILNASIGIVAVLMSEEKGYARIMTVIGVNFIFGMSLFVYNLKKAKKVFVWEYAKFAILFNLPLMLHYISQYILDQFDRIMIQKMISMSAAAIYGVAYNAGLIVKIVTNSIGNAIVPWQYDKLEKREFKKLDDALFPVFVIVAVLSLVFSAFAPELIALLADKKYSEAIYVIPPIAMSVFFSFFYSVFANVEFYYDENRFTMYISMFGAALNIGLNYIFIDMFGYIAAAYTTLFCYIIYCLGHYLYMNYSVKKKLKVDRIFEPVRLLVLSAALLLSGLLIIFLYDKMVIRYILIGISLIICIWKRKFIIKAIKSVKKSKK